ncbi:MAG: hypothetical protein CO093_09060 [Alphaproteobacteria bacterium CG_4_9_14_3_um_filter_47_13]|nr:MAG: hypothetical protein CO093_09060 [Alphaproteobacteria bacterium CG_4_9_14_3_um_filter_47_13]
MSDQNDVLCHLINVCENTKYSYESAARKTTNPFIETVFNNMAYIRSNIIIDLSEFLKANGGNPENRKISDKNRESLFDELDINSASNPEKILVTCLEETEDRALKEFDKALSENIPLHTKAVLAQKLGTLNETHDYMKALKTRFQEDSKKNSSSV